MPRPCDRWSSTRQTAKSAIRSTWSACRAAVPLCSEAVIAGLRGARQQLGYAYKLHITPNAQDVVPAALFHTTARLQRAEGIVEEPLAELLVANQLGHEWEWEGTPEVTLTLVDDTAEAVALFNTYSPRFVASLVSQDAAAYAHFFRMIEAPCVGNGFTRWLDGQFALHRPELGLTNWQDGRLFAPAQYPHWRRRLQYPSTRHADRSWCPSVAWRLHSLSPAAGQ